MNLPAQGPALSLTEKETVRRCLAEIEQRRL